MKIISSLTGLVLIYLIYGFYLSQADISIIPRELKPPNPPEFYDYRGSINVRTSRSSGSSVPGEVIGEARAAGLDFLILTDTSRKDDNREYSGYHERLLVLDEKELSFLDSRLLYLSTKSKDRATDEKDQNIFLTDFLSQRASANLDQLLFLAMPFNNGPSWTGPYPSGLDGLEILNPKAIAQKSWQKSKLNTIWSFVTYPFNPQLAFLRLFSEPTEELALWDKLSQERPTWGLAGAEANAKAIPLADYLIKFPSYQMSLGLMTNHVLLSTELTGSLEMDKGKLFSALKQGQFYISLDLLGDPRGFNAVLIDKDRTHPMGSQVKLSKGMKIRVNLPIEPRAFYEIVLLKNGQREMISNLQELNYDVKSSGTYRIVVRVSPTFPLPDAKKWISWIYTNPFFVSP